MEQNWIKNRNNRHNKEIKEHQPNSHWGRFSCSAAAEYNIKKQTDKIISLRSLSLQCEVNILMSGESNFYIFSRCGDAITNTTSVCYISKELESARKFVSFAILEPKEGNKSTWTSLIIQSFIDRIKARRNAKKEVLAKCRQVFV